MKIVCSLGILILLTTMVHGQNKPEVKITFVNTVNNAPVVLDSVTYKNCWGEDYTISKLKYYISNIKFYTLNKGVISEANSYHLINEEDSSSKSFSIVLPPGIYSSLSFLIGVDSLMNVSGAQTDALDPLNGMFWTWNTGYIMFKLEGNSPQSNLLNNKIEYHLGGFTQPHNVLKKIQLNWKDKTIPVNKGSVTKVIIRTSIDKIWAGGHDLKIRQTPLCTTSGSMAVRIAENVANAVALINIVSQ